MAQTGFLLCKERIIKLEINYVLSNALISAEPTSSSCQKQSSSYSTSQVARLLFFAPLVTVMNSCPKFYTAPKRTEEAEMADYSYDRDSIFIFSCLIIKSRRKCPTTGRKFPSYVI